MLPCPGEPTSHQFKSNTPPALAPEGYIYIQRGENIWYPGVAERTDKIREFNSRGLQLPLELHEVGVGEDVWEKGIKEIG